MRDYLLSLPERVLRSAAALAAGLVNELGEASLPASVRRTRLYRNLVEATLRFLIEQVGEVEGVFPAEDQLAGDFLLRRTAGNGIELIGILTFRASPVWVLAALADLSGAGRALVSEIAASLRQEGLIAPDSHPHSVDQILDALETTAARAASTLNTPPLDIHALRGEWREIRASAAGLAPDAMPGVDLLERKWQELRDTAAAEQRGVFELSALMALETLHRFPRGLKWLGQTVGVAGRATSGLFASSILDHYTGVLSEIRAEGLAAWWAREFRPYLAAAARQFAPGKKTWTQRMLGRSLDSRGRF